LAINAKGGENIKPKAKGPHHHNFKKFQNKAQYLEVHFLKIGIYFKTLLKAKRRISFRGSFV
jgi:hypothetical protein